MQDIQPTKTCKHCKQPLPLSAFYPSKGGRHGVKAVCKQCIRSAKRKVQYVPAPPGLKASLCWSGRIDHHGARNENCRHYSKCLNAAATADLNFSCQACEFERDQAGASYRLADLPGMIALILAVKIDTERIGAIIKDVYANINEWISYLAGEPIRDRQADHWGRPE